MPSVEGSRSWETRRSAFRHDWLKNKYLNRLDGFLAGLDEPHPDFEWLLEFVEDDLPLWEERREEARWLIRSYEEHMSPRTLLNRPPLSRCPSEAQRWLRDLVHQLWRTRYAIVETVKDANETLEEVNRKYEELMERTKEIRNVGQLKTLRPQFVAFREACSDLDQALGNFLKEVKPV